VTEPRSVSTSKIIRTVLAAWLILGAGQARSETKDAAQRLGYPPGTKLLILHADDLAVSHSVDQATFAALDRKAVSAASIMIPCPWLTEVAAYAKAHPGADLGLHLTLNSEWKTYRWGPVTPRAQVPSLLDPDGYLEPHFPGEPGTYEVIKHAKPDEVEREIRAQVERAEQMGIHPTHLDSHVGALYSRPELFAVLLKVAHEYHLPFRANPAMYAQLHMAPADQDIITGAFVAPTKGVAAGDWKASYLRALSAVKPGLTEMVFHLGYDDAELQAISVGHADFGAAWRQRDFDVVTSPEFKRALAENQIDVIGWKEVKRQLK
jgi:predicted glycoside hydrolase/deacetylase ChbG (UPF0249 family)